MTKVAHRTNLAAEVDELMSASNPRGQTLRLVAEHLWRALNADWDLRLLPGKDRHQVLDSMANWIFAARASTPGAATMNLATPLDEKRPLKSSFPNHEDDLRSLLREAVSSFVVACHRHDFTPTYGEAAWICSQISWATREIGLLEDLADMHSIL